MKKALSLLLVLVMCLSLCACGGGNDTPAQDTTETPTTTEAPTEPQMTKDEMLAVAESVSFETLTRATHDNMVAAQMNYCGKTIKATGYISNIMADHIELIWVTGSSVTIKAYLPVEEIVKLETGQAVEFVGMMADSIEKKVETQLGASYDAYSFEMNAAYIVTDRFMIEGRIGGKNQSFTFWDFYLPNNPYARCLYFSENADLSELSKFGDDNVIIEARIVRNGTSDEYHDAIILSILE